MARIGRFFQEELHPEDTIGFDTAELIIPQIVIRVWKLVAGELVVRPVMATQPLFEIFVRDEDFFFEIIKRFN